MSCARVVAVRVLCHNQGSEVSCCFFRSTQAAAQAAAARLLTQQQRNSAALAAYHQHLTEAGEMFDEVISEVEQRSRALQGHCSSRVEELMKCRAEQRECKAALAEALLAQEN